MYGLPFDEISDKRTRGWFLVDSLRDVAVLVTIYLLMVFLVPKLMERKRPFKLKLALIAYNLSMALLNTHIAKELFLSSKRMQYNYLCQPCKEINHPDELRIASAVWWFYISKLLEFSDTLFFILRKKRDQLSFLHIYHHSTMFPLWWIAIKWVPTGSTFFPTMINSAIHVIMYTYYTLSALGSSFQKFLWWKKYLTVLQLMQFTVGVLWAIQAIYNGCDFPIWINCVTIAYMISFLFLFGKFYLQKYTAKYLKDVK